MNSDSHLGCKGLLCGFMGCQFGLRLFCPVPSNHLSLPLFLYHADIESTSRYHMAF